MSEGDPDPEGDEEFWGSVGTDRSPKSLLINILSDCEMNVVEMVDDDPLEIDLVKRCPSIKFSTGSDQVARIYCEECGFVCSVAVKRENQLEVPAVAEADELDEFLSIAGSECFDFDDDGDPYG